MKKTKRLNTKIKDKISNCIANREMLTMEIKRITELKSHLDQSIIDYFNEYDIKDFEFKEKSVRVQKNKTRTWDINSLYKFLNQKFGKKIAKNIVKEKTVVTYHLDENELHKLITAKKVTSKVLKKFIDVKESRPFIRLYAIAKEI